MIDNELKKRVNDLRIIEKKTAKETSEITGVGIRSVYKIWTERRYDNHPEIQALTKQLKIARAKIRIQQIQQSIDEQ